ncbi:hypothetical protein FA592_01150 [Sulfurospirillum diekertiae]|uniref:Uncharacterized protein n=1 Tax=Sulfurospirillum diekertiae TaxID=1854492 RepID=A0A1Y0HM07_9BACT|nr:hypothetical protein [Sulfurospirillum diekertiae]ARU48970.1 hypothetical protein Sdiek1_1811 [Sulfurospirillum diekertiae]ASC93789.1 hypothetical protein Sdiek2_1774 [Sulfurospirillum diekertiae]ATB69833.1 hypothetical protein SJPD1_1728 [Sulfurospirillum diekertiae]QIR74898.1 hypothetical protein FA584_01160 [Sulfurospirillum diekertiae]QIR77564.1 hypothetical protein FA592_01150 [Sulfurospirillum diekertiae]
MEANKLKQELERAEIEIEEMSMQLADMLGAALYFAGAKKEDLPKAIDLYLKGLDEVFEDEDEDSEMGFEEVVEVIEYIKAKNPKLFQH